MRRVEQKFSIGFNARRSRKGPVWVGRFRNTEGLRAVEVYVVANGFRAGMVRRAEEYGSLGAWRGGGRRYMGEVGWRSW